MKKQFITLLFLVLCWAFPFVAIKAQTPNLSPDDWTLVHELTDSFDMLPLDTVLWATDNQKSWERDRFYLTPDNVEIDNNGILKLITKKEKVIRDTWNTCDAETYFYTAAKIFTKFRLTPGAYYEIRAKIPNSKNSVGQSFWFVRGGLPYAEIDVFETEAQQPRFYPSALHHGPNSCSSIYDYEAFGSQLLTEDLSEKFHVFGLDWQEHVLKFYIDDRLLYELDLLEADVPGLDPNCYTNPPASLPVSVLHSQYGQLGVRAIQEFEGHIEPTEVGDVFEIDYYNVFIRKPTVSLVSQNCSTNKMVYRAYTGVPGDKFIWNYNTTAIPNAVITQFTTVGYSEIEFVYNGGTTVEEISAMVERTYEKGYPHAYTSGAIDVQSDFTDPIQIGSYNPDFHFGPLSCNNTNWSISADAVSSNPNSYWILELKVGNNWVPQSNAIGTSVNFSGLLQNATYRVTHFEYGGCSIWIEKSKEFTANYSTDFFYADPVHDGVGTFTISDVTAVVPTGNDRWSIAEVGTNNYSQFQVGNTASFTGLSANTTYSIKHELLNSANVSIANQVKEVYVKANSDFNFFIPGAEHWIDDLDLKRVGAESHLTVHSEGNNITDEWYIQELDYNGEILDPVLEGPKYGPSATFTSVVPNGRYMVKHGTYHANMIPWTETRRVLQLNPVKYLNDDANYQGDMNLLPYSMEKASGFTTSYFYLPVESKVTVQKRHVDIENEDHCNFIYTNQPIDNWVFLQNLVTGGVFYNFSNGTFGEIQDMLIPKGYYKVYYYGNLASDEELYIHDEIYEFSPGPDTCIQSSMVLINDNFIGATDSWHTGMPGNPNDGIDKYYKLKVNSPAKIKFETCNTVVDFDIRMEIFKANGQKIKFKNGNSFTLDYYNNNVVQGCNTIAEAFLSEGYYYIVVDAPAGTTASFQLDVEIINCVNTLLPEGPEPSEIVLEDRVESSSIKATDFDALKLLPNPASDFLSIQGLESDVQYQIFDLNGQALQKGTYTAEQRIPIDALKSGMYFIQCRKNNEQKTLKFTVIR